MLFSMTTVNNIENKNTSLINHYANQLSTAIKELGGKISDEDVERISIFLVRAMGSELRNYHRPEHPLDVSKYQPPIARIAGLFHDLVYVQVDPHWKVFLGDHLIPMIPTENFTLNVKEKIGQTNEQKDKWTKICTTIFGFEAEEKLTPLGGLNEYLSAIVMAKLMEPYLTPKNLLKVISCVEATIPFRRIDASGNSPSKRLKERLNKASNSYEISFTEEDINQTAIDCRHIVENDLSGFRSEKLGFFLSDSWNVLSENHATLRNTFFLISDYRKAVFGLIGFFQMLDPENMFWNDVTPISDQSHYFAKRARYNLKNGAEYMKAFFLSTVFLDAIASETGGDAPYELLVGAKKSSREHTPPEIGQFLPLEESPDFKNAEEKDVYHVLKNGRVVRAKFDRKECPLGAYLYHRLHALNRFEEFFQFAVSFHKNEMKGKEFIQKFPKNISQTVLKAVSELALNRTQKILNLNSN